ncbi:competence/damage-inducible protein A [Sulfurimonas sp. MAG313]|nr:molybdopterin-binding protein [Sulfurimonas sp. MAG313]MDF1881662.1 competence/damage-inducible protein A [Sulfurimonas sp. MAG313]
MTQNPHIYAVIIGSEILDRRRKDKHFDYLSQALAKRGFSLFASLTIKDDKTLIENTYKMIKNDEQSIMLSFGGIGSTPDDLTRQLSANIFSDSTLYRHPRFEKDILERLEERAYPHPIKMADLPKNAGLLFNPINNMSGFHLEKRFFFMPGFPEMAQPMIEEIVRKYLPLAKQPFTKGFLAQCGEGRIQELMLKISDTVELSSLPMMNNEILSVEFSLSSFYKKNLEHDFSLFTDFLDAQKIEYRLL